MENIGTYTFSDIIRDKFIEEFTAITVPQLFLTLGLAFVLSLFVVLVYRLTYSGVMFSRSFALGLILMSLITSLAILAISTNVVLSLGMVGALSIVRFRTAVKEANDTIFMFWAIVVGIITGAGYVTVAIIATLFIGIVYMLVSMLGKKAIRSAYLVVIRYDAAAETDVAAAVSVSLGKARVKSKTVSGGATELVLETKLPDGDTSCGDILAAVSGVEAVNVISYNGNTVL